ncbi:MAG: HAMP domain-containing protein [Candidatus Marinimicrobia bacterium]|nr:HAMP domain-containing protein [Candidatus Neomarinimicrobiota bacterium]
MEKIELLYSDFGNSIPPDQTEIFDRDVESLMLSQKAIDLSVDLYRKQIDVYSRYIFYFILLSVLIVFVLSISLITRPLHRLQTATQALMAGDQHIQITENRFSPINDLIVSFNTMVRELDRQRQIAIEAEKQLVWKEVARIMAHEIKNPLTPIKLSVERLEMKAASDSEFNISLLQESLGIIKEEVNNLQGLVERFRGFASLPEARPEFYKLDTQINEIIGAYRSNHNIALNIDANLPLVYADKFQIKQAVVNLIQNAIQSTDRDDLQIDINLLSGTTNVMLKIKDNGPGISVEHMKKIFEPYFTTRRKGTGLGLPIVKRIIENHGGNIKISSEAGQGTTVTVTIPIIEKER